MTPELPTWRIWLMLPIVLALHTTWLAHWQPWGARVDLPLLTVVSVSLLLGWEIGAGYGVVAGLLTGFFAATNLGSFALSRMAAGGVFGLFDKGFSRDNPLAPPICAAGATLLSNLVFLIMSPTDYPLMWWLQVTATSVVAHTFLIWPIHFLIQRFVLPPTRMTFV